jgi:hypothetical protein
VSDKAVDCCCDPDVAVTVTVENTGVGPLLMLSAPLPPPQPEIRPSAAMATHMRSRWRRLRRLFQPTTQSVSARVVVPDKMGRLFGRIAPVSVSAVTVNVVLPPFAPGVIVAGLKAQEAPTGSPEQENETAELNPF